ncbi:MAG: HAMP domain-containing sensor histidine kinase [Candidatus Cloacimonadaceae bacterium]
MNAPKLFLESSKLEEIQSILIQALAKAGLELGTDYLIQPVDNVQEYKAIDDDKRFYLDEMAKLNNDLTNMQRQLAKANAELSRLAELRNRFVGMAAHDLRNPLGVIKNFSEFLKTDLVGSINDDQMDIVNTIYNTAVFMQRLVEGILDVSSMQSGKVELNKSRNELNLILKQNVKLNQTLAKQNNISILYQGTDEDLFLDIDVVKIRQVLNNLIGNAAKYSPASSTIHCSLSRKGNFAHICVKDQGIGIPIEEQKSIFEPFKHLNRGGSKEKSVGLGLFIVKNIVEAHGGEISLKSEPGKGSIFCISLPIDGS